MARFHSEGAKRAVMMGQLPFEALTMDDLRELHQMLSDKDLVHVDDQAARDAMKEIAA